MRNGPLMVAVGRQAKGQTSERGDWDGLLAAAVRLLVFPPSLFPLTTMSIMAQPSWLHSGLTSLAFRNS